MPTRIVGLGAGTTCGRGVVRRLMRWHEPIVMSPRGPAHADECREPVRPSAAAFDAEAPYTGAAARPRRGASPKLLRAYLKVGAG